MNKTPEDSFQVTSEVQNPKDLFSSQMTFEESQRIDHYPNKEAELSSDAENPNKSLHCENEKTSFVQYLGRSFQVSKNKKTKIHKFSELLNSKNWKRTKIHNHV
ncbi:uncharacterized protein OCT59_003454 [Rhizophagus irregularis]|uniref:uncharacterized protein n=1 Tax=Rhizophagus irregularis TaxID=588596 RepID=UPI003333AB14|nr:hypothetical protein OCT59_003454 [Rhizophagus irregularis]